MEFNKKNLLSIKGLDYREISKMNDIRFEKYYGALLKFVDDFPSQESELKQLFSAKDYGAFTKMLLGISDMFEELKAVGFAQSCRRLLDELGNQKYNIVEAHLTYLLAEISGLSIDIQMTLHEGEMPKQGEAADEAAPESENAGDDSSKDNDEPVIKNILAVDDVSLLLMGLKSILKNTEYKVIGVTSGEDALTYTAKHCPDLFILDIEMPVMDGYELAKRLRKSGQTAPIIFLTGNATKDYVQKAISVGAADFIVKPVNKEQVLEKIRKHIG